MADSDQLQVEIWSDVMCPFCYIGKRQFEAALAQLEDPDRIQVTWKSFQLDPALKTARGQSLYDYLAKRKGMTVEQSRQMHDQVAKSAAAVGLDYRFDRVIVSNSHAAHRLIQVAKTQNKAGDLEEALFRSYFTEGRDIGDRATLEELGLSVGLTSSQTAEAWDDPAGDWRRKVEVEASEARALGSTGVPFFVFQRQYAVTGAQGQDAFRRVLEKVSRENPR